MLKAPARFGTARAYCQDTINYRRFLLDENSMTDAYPLGRLCAAVVLCAAIAATTPNVHAESYHFQHEHVLGTSFELICECDDARTASQVEQVVLAEVDRLALVLSGYRNDSEFSRWVRGESVGQLSRDLHQVLQRAECYRQLTEGAFDIRAESVKALFEAAGTPTPQARHALVRKMAKAPYGDSPETQRHDDLAMSLDALAKGYILDCAAEAVMRNVVGVQGCLVNLGGDVRVSGSMHVDAHITNPFDSSEHAASIATVTLGQGRAMATSGNYRRFIQHHGRRLNHVFDPRTALPVSQIASATVIADSAMDADALATTMSVLPVAESLGLARQLGVGCYIVDSQGKRYASVDWPTEEDGHSQDVAHFTNLDDEANAHKGGLVVDFTLAANNQGGRYRRPYVAVWLEDKDAFPVKTAVLWLKTTGPGPRWHRDLTRWYRNDRMRKLTEDRDLIETISGATRGPGEYTARFDGTDNAGKALEPGTYMLCIEVAREHGTYQIIRQRITWGSEPVKETKLKPNPEISAASYTFTPPTRVQ